VRHRKNIGYLELEIADILNVATHIELPPWGEGDSCQRGSFPQGKSALLQVPTTTGVSGARARL
jgi:hypothetical protein